MSHSPEPPSALSALSPTLPGVPDRLLRSRWLSYAGDYYNMTCSATFSTTKAFSPGTSESV
jgi:hypothetical protein